MKTLTLPGVSFRKDPQALACLLYELFDIAQKNCGSLEPSDIVRAVRNLGFVGSPGAVCRHLVEEGFLTGNNETGYWITKRNEIEMDRFFKANEESILPICLSARESAQLFDKIGPQGTPTEQAALRIFRLLTALQDELSAFPLVVQKELSVYADHEAARTVNQEHLWWLISRINLLIEEMKVLDRSDSPEAMTVMAIAYAEAYELQMQLEAGIAVMNEHERAMRRIARNEHLVALITDTGKIINKLVTTIVESDSRS